MNKKGFTLVELLAVIAILAILVIIALPNVMGMFRSAKKNSFITEIKEIYKTAESTWMSESMFNTNEVTYSRCTSGCTNELDLSGRRELEYYIVLNKNGKVVKYYATDGTYQFSFNGSSGELNINDIKDVQEIANINPSDVIDIGTISDNNSGGNSGGGESGITRTIYTNDSNVFTIGSPVPNSASTYNDYNSFKSEFFLKHVVENGIVTESYIGWKKNGNVTFFRGGVLEEAYNHPINDENISKFEEKYYNYYNYVNHCYSENCYYDNYYINITIDRYGNSLEFSDNSLNVYPVNYEGTQYYALENGDYIDINNIALNKCSISSSGISMCEDVDYNINY